MDPKSWSQILQKTPWFLLQKPPNLWKIHQNYKTACCLVYKKQKKKHLIATFKKKGKKRKGNDIRIVTWQDLMGSPKPSILEQFRRGGDEAEKELGRQYHWVDRGALMKLLGFIPQLPEMGVSTQPPHIRL